MTRQTDRLHYELYASQYMLFYRFFLTVVSFYWRQLALHKDFSEVSDKWSLESSFISILNLVLHDSIFLFLQHFYIFFFADTHYVMHMYEHIQNHPHTRVHRSSTSVRPEMWRPPPVGCQGDLGLLRDGSSARPQHHVGASRRQGPVDRQAERCNCGGIASTYE